MGEFKLSKRLKAVASMIPHGHTIADIGSDHAYLPCYLCLRGSSPGAVAGEVAEGPYEAARQQVRKWKLEDVVSVRRGDGLEVIAPGEVDTVVIAGMGGALIADILAGGTAGLSGVSRLVLQPNTAAERVRRWLFEYDWELIKEMILEENGQIYEMLAAEPGDGKAPYRGSGEAGLRAGPFLIKEKSAAFQKKWRCELKKWRNIDAQLQQAVQTSNIAARRQAVQEKIKEAEEILNGQDG